MAGPISSLSLKSDTFVEVNLNSENFKLREYERQGQQLLEETGESKGKGKGIKGQVKAIAHRLSAGAHKRRHTHTHQRSSAEALQDLQYIEASIIEVESQPAEVANIPSSSAAVVRPCSGSTISSSFCEIDLQDSCTEHAALPDGPQRALQHAATMQWLQHADDGTAPTGFQAVSAWFRNITGKAKCTAPAAVLAAAPTSARGSSSCNDSQHQTESGSSVLGMDPCAWHGSFVAAPVGHMPGSTSKGRSAARGSKGGSMLLSCLFGTSAVDNMQPAPKSAAVQQRHNSRSLSAAAADDNYDDSAHLGQDPCAYRLGSTESLRLPTSTATSWLCMHSPGASRKANAADKSTNHSLYSTGCQPPHGSGSKQPAQSASCGPNPAHGMYSCRASECSFVAAVGSRTCSVDMRVSSRSGSSTARQASAGSSSLQCHSLSETGSKWAAQHALHGPTPTFGMQSCHASDCSYVAAAGSSLGTGCSSRAGSDSGSGHHYGGSGTLCTD